MLAQYAEHMFNWPRVVATGSKGWKDTDTVLRTLEQLDRKTLVFVGGAPGADMIVESCAKYLGMVPIPVEAPWSMVGNDAESIRNQFLFDIAKPKRVLAFWDGSSGETLDTVTRAVDHQSVLEVFVSLPYGGPLRLEPERNVKPTLLRAKEKGEDYADVILAFINSEVL